jgi:hypothetical protein
MSDRVPGSEADRPPATPDGSQSGRPEDLRHSTVDRVPCPNCCRTAPVTGRSMGLLFFQCELCETTGATPDPDEALTG